MKENDLQFEYISVCGYSEYGNKEDLLRDLELLKNIHKPDELVNQIIDIDDEDVTESGIIFSDKSPERLAQKETNTIYIVVTDGEIHFHADFEFRMLNDVQQSFDEAVGILDEMEIRKFWAEISIHRDFDELTVPVDWSTDYDVSGIRIDHESSKYIIQEDNEGERSTKATKNLNGDFVIEKDESMTFIETGMTSTQEFLMQF